MMLLTLVYHLTKLLAAMRDRASVNDVTDLGISSDQLLA